MSCFPWYSLVIAFIAGLLTMLAFWLTLARIAMSDFYQKRKERLSLGDRDNGR